MCEERNGPGADDAADNDDAPAAAAEDPASSVFIVGVGASAGGFEALTALLTKVNLDRMALVIVQHLAPTHESFLPELLSRTSHVEVVAATDGAKVAPSHVYVIPPNADLAILQGTLHLMTPQRTGLPHGPHLPVDYFFRSLAGDQGSRSIGIVLSGTGSDGTFGLRAIKEAGGITFAQDPMTAKHGGMPRSAFESGWADFCLPPDGIAQELASISHHPYLARAKPFVNRAPDGVAKLIVLMRAAFGNDLSYYKPTTVERRIERRMALHKVEKLNDYVKFVQANPDELRRLYKDMLIGVTSFFRDPDSFDALKSRVFPRLIDNKDAGGHIRVWVPACATGEEAYSLAIALLEFLDTRASEFRLQIFGTDVDDVAIHHARRGVYPENISLDVSPARLHRFFIKRESDYQVARRVRDMVVFSSQNVTKDAPFSRLDLVSCRNLLIYLRPPMQKKVLRILHYSLQPAGYLMLGTSETAGEASDCFSLVDRKHKIYARRGVVSKPALDFGFGVQAPDVSAPIQPNVTQRTASSLATVADRKILETYGPPGVVINEDFDVIHLRGGTGPYFEPLPGTPSFNILRLARSELHVDLRRAIHDAKQTNQRTTIETRLTEDGKTRALEIEILPIVEPDTRSRCFLVLFHEPKPRRDVAVAGASSSADGSPQDERLNEVERELVATKEYLQSTIEQLETANEELKSSNEELQSSNEELQSTNEELGTSKEELQSSNEELTTVNDELQNRMGELQLTNDDLHNVLAGIGEAIVIVGIDLRIRRFTQSAEKLLNLVPSDVGRSISQLNSFIRRHRIEELAARVIERLLPIEERVLCSDQRWYDLRVTPYRTLDHTIKGALIVLVAAPDSGPPARAGGEAAVKPRAKRRAKPTPKAKAKVTPRPTKKRR